ncbi:Cytochrome c family protein [Candidatus Rhodobacter oscarellae]|uniref:Cytochrome c family protein n=1 Tax=Candidatus Rhodobacter oscarellae TaxID=1675527 RepID=A0A0J9EBB3_9RHOB|nr:cytochrome c [Candidatus Rhodobacter lobularis]KMW60075.1 Cytochrome c family protein [Candidatus Rhodobacter lobularis]
MPGGLSKLSIPALACALVTGCAALNNGAGLEPDPENLAYGRALYTENCAVCHGAKADGLGPHAANLDRPPPNLTLLAARNNGTFDQDYVMSTIFASPSEEIGPMPAFAHRDLGPLIVVERDGLGTPVFTDLLAIANYLESLQVPPAGES